MGGANIIGKQVPGTSVRMSSTCTGIVEHESGHNEVKKNGIPVCCMKSVW